MNGLRAVGRPFAWLLGTRGEARFRAVVLTRSWVGLCERCDEAVRAKYSGDGGFEVVSRAGHGYLFLDGYRGQTSGFLVGLVATFRPSGETRVMLGVSRWSRLERWRGFLAAGFALVAFCIAFVVLVLPIGGRLLGELAAAVALAVAVVTGLLALRALGPVFDLVARRTGGRLTDHEMEAIGELVRVTAEECPATTVTREPA